MIKLITDHSIAYDSNDHKHPWGTRRDNTSCIPFVNEALDFFGSDMSYLDLGCAGGQLVKEFKDRGVFSLGLEGSDYCIVNNQYNWPELHNKNLFTCDISRDFSIMDNNEDDVKKFDLITAWEVLEHIPEDRIDCLLKNINKHLKKDGVFLGSIATFSDKPEGVELHVSTFSEKKWRNEIIESSVLIDSKYPFDNYARYGRGIFHVCFRRFDNSDIRFENFI